MNKKIYFLFIIFISIVTTCTHNTNTISTSGTSDNNNFIKGRIIDTNGNGIKTTVYLLDSNLIYIDSCITNDSGYYFFEVENSGKYIISVLFNNKYIQKEIIFNKNSSDNMVEDIIIINENDSITEYNDSLSSSFSSDTSSSSTTSSLSNSTSSSTSSASSNISSSEILDTTSSSSVNSTSSSTPIDTTYSLIPLGKGYQMTIQFINSTNKFPDSLIYVAVIGKDSADNWAYLTNSGTPKTIQNNESSDNWFFSLKQITGFQVPKTFTSARVYISVEQKLVMKSILDVNGNIGIVQPNIANSNDPNYNIIFEWIEFTVANNSFWGNTTQVDQFGFPLTLSVYKEPDILVSTLGITASREEIFNKFELEAPEEFKTLIKYPYRIIAPAKGEFNDNGMYANYYDQYVNEIWEQYKTDTLYIHHPLGEFKGIVLNDDRFQFTRLSDNKKFYISQKPTTQEIFEGSGTLASGNSVELALEAWFCAAFNRHVVEYTDTDFWNNPLYYYKKYPMNFYSKFFHDISINNKAYGFCYDDVNDQSTLIYTPDVRGIVINILW